jgi:hypothetical protein
MEGRRFYYVLYEKIEDYGKNCRIFQGMIIIDDNEEQRVRRMT